MKVLNSSLRWLTAQQWMLAASFQGQERFWRRMAGQSVPLIPAAPAPKAKVEGASRLAAGMGTAPVPHNTACGSAGWRQLTLHSPLVPKVLLIKGRQRVQLRMRQLQTGEDAPGGGAGGQQCESQPGQRAEALVATGG